MKPVPHRPLGRAANRRVRKLVRGSWALVCDPPKRKCSCAGGCVADYDRGGFGTVSDLPRDRQTRGRGLASASGGSSGTRVRAPRRFGAVLLPARRLGAGRARARSGAAGRGLAGDARRRFAWPAGRADPRGRASSPVSIGPRVDYSPALGLAEPLAAPVPFQPSYEDRPGAPDRIFATVDDAAYERLVAVWIDALARAGAASADLLHLHHLTPANEAARRAFPALPVLGQLHGTELAMLRILEAGAPAGLALRARLGSERMRGWARRLRAADRPARRGG